MSAVNRSRVLLSTEPESPPRVNTSQRKWEYIQAADGLSQFGGKTRVKLMKATVLYVIIGAIVGTIMALLGFLFPCAWAGAVAGGKSGIAVAGLQEGHNALNALPHDFDDWSWEHHPVEMMLEQVEEFLADSRNHRLLKDVYCPLTGQLLREPLQIMTCRHIFEDAALAQYLQENAGQCPKASCGQQHIDPSQLAVAHGTKIRVLCRLYQELGRKEILPSISSQQKKRIPTIRTTLLRVARNAYQALESKYQEDIQNPNYRLQDVRETRRVLRDQIGDDMLALLLETKAEIGLAVDDRVELLRYLKKI